MADGARPQSTALSSLEALPRLQMSRSCKGGAQIRRTLCNLLYTHGIFREHRSLYVWAFCLLQCFTLPQPAAGGR